MKPLIAPKYVPPEADNSPIKVWRVVGPEPKQRSKATVKGVQHWEGIDRVPHGYVRASQ